VLSTSLFATFLVLGLVTLRIMQEPNEPIAEITDGTTEVVHIAKA